MMPEIEPASTSATTSDSFLIVEPPLPLAIDSTSLGSGRTLRDRQFAWPLPVLRVSPSARLVKTGTAIHGPRRRPDPGLRPAPARGAPDTRRTAEARLYATLFEHPFLVGASASDEGLVAPTAS